MEKKHEGYIFYRGHMEILMKKLKKFIDSIVFTYKYQMIFKLVRSDLPKVDPEVVSLGVLNLIGETDAWKIDIYRCRAQLVFTYLMLNNFYNLGWIEYYGMIFDNHNSKKD